MKLFDAHNHLQSHRFGDQLENVIQRAAFVGVKQMAIKGCCENDWLQIITLINNHPTFHFSFGLHPWFLAQRTPQWQKTLKNLLTTYPQASIGEIGIDHAIENRNDAEQEQVFIEQLQIAEQFKRPVSIHCRQAWGRLIELLDQTGNPTHGMLIHCFGGSKEIAQELVKRGAYISFSASITRPNAKKAKEAIRSVPNDRILIETDAPDLLPHGMTADFNEPAYLPLVLKKAAELKGISEIELAKQTYQNALHFFHQ